MGNFFDILIVGAFVASVVICFKLGIFRLLIPFRKLVAFILAWSLKTAPFINGLVGKVIKADGFKAFLNGRIDALWGDKLRAAASDGGPSVAQRFDDVFGFTGEIFSNLKEFCISLYDKQFVSGAAESTHTPSERVEVFVRDTVSYVTDVTASFFTTLLSFIILYVAFSFAFKYGARFLDMLFSEGLFGLLNHSLGGIVGVFYGFLICWVMSIVFVMIIPLITPISIGGVVSGYFDITEWFYTKFFMSQILGMSL